MGNLLIRFFDYAIARVAEWGNQNGVSSLVLA